MSRGRGIVGTRRLWGCESLKHCKSRRLGVARVRGFVRVAFADEAHNGSIDSRWRTSGKASGAAFAETLVDQGGDAVRDESLPGRSPLGESFESVEDEVEGETEFVKGGAARLVELDVCGDARELALGEQSFEAIACRISP